MKKIMVLAAIVCAAYQVFACRPGVCCRPHHVPRPPVGWRSAHPGVDWATYYAGLATGVMATTTGGCCLPARANGVYVLQQPEPVGIFTQPATVYMPQTSVPQIEVPTYAPVTVPAQAPGFVHQSQTVVTETDVFTPVQPVYQTVVPQSSYQSITVVNAPPRPRKTLVGVNVLGLGVGINY